MLFYIRANDLAGGRGERSLIGPERSWKWKPLESVTTRTQGKLSLLLGTVGTALPGLPCVIPRQVLPGDLLYRQGNGLTISEVNISSSKYGNTNLNPGLLNSKDIKESI